MPRAAHPCPTCGEATDLRRSLLTVTGGGVLLPRLTRPMICRRCRTRYNGRTGAPGKESINGAVLAYLIQAAVFVGLIGVLVVLSSL